jgi:hypothetical protein
MSVVDLDSGRVPHSLEIESSNEGSAPLVEWMGAKRAFVWGFGAGGPLLVDLSVDPPRQVRVLPELFGLDVAYPEEMNSIGVFYDPASDSFHSVAYINKEDDQSVYIYHSESGQVEKLPGDRQAILILPGDQRMPLTPMLDTPGSDDTYAVIFVDAAEQPQPPIQVRGHTPRNYPMLSTRLLPGGRRMLFGSSQGVSLVGLPGGETLAFWRLAGAENTTLPSLMLDPDGRAVIVTTDPAASATDDAQGGLLFWIPLPE